MNTYRHSEFIVSNLNKLNTTTDMKQTLCSKLYEESLISSIQKTRLSDRQIPNETRATYLYRDIAPSWNDKQFFTFLTVLRTHGDLRALAVFEDDSHLGKLVDKVEEELYDPQEGVRISMEQQGSGSGGPNEAEFNKVMGQFNMFNQQMTKNFGNF